MMGAVLRVDPLGGRWPTIDPFLVCVHHVDNYPQGNAEFGPDASLSGRIPGRDMEGKDGWRMYFGRTVPGFPAHPHRGFETITIVRQGIVDHSDSLGSSARFGAGDVQWLTAGRGIVHAEMFPLVERNTRNPLELLQIWLNLPARSKMAEPNFTMYWAEDIPGIVTSDAQSDVEFRYIAGVPFGSPATSATVVPPNSWAADPEADLAIWTITLSPGARCTLPPASGMKTRRQLFFFEGSTLNIDEQVIARSSAIEVRCDKSVELVNGPERSEILMLQARPIGESVVSEGPFVMGSIGEIQQAYADYRETGVGAWPWPSTAPVHGEGTTKFASRGDDLRVHTNLDETRLVADVPEAPLGR
ncbi:MAG: pirin family protein [Thiobacillus sp.]|nr:pirin family protein [Thiobacillus sp.]